MAETFQVTAIVVRDDEGVQQLTLVLPASCPEEEEEPEPEPVIQPPPAPLSVVGMNQQSPTLRINVTWPHVVTATRYQMQREDFTNDPGVWVDLPFTGINPSYTDTDVVDGDQYRYRVRSGNQDNDGVPQYSAYTESNLVTADAADDDPLPTPMTDVFVPKNLGALATGAAAMTISWDAVPDATHYKIWADFRHIWTVTAPTVSLAIGTGTGLDGLQMFRNKSRYRVSAVIDGVDSFLSAPVHAIGNEPGWDNGATPQVPSAPECIPVWQGGDIDAPRNIVRWKAPGQGSGSGHAHWDVYRDGVKIKGDLFVMYYVDDDVVAGTDYDYQVRRTYWRPGGVKATSSSSSATTCSTRSAAPAAASWTPAVTQVKNDDSILFKFAACAGARDYRIYPQGTMDYKYRGDHSLLEIEFNGIAQDVNTTFVLEALDQWGPFQHDEIPKADPHHMHVGGQGDPSAVPYVLASTTITTTPTKRNWTGEAPIILDCFYVKPVYTQENGVEPQIWQRQQATFAANNAANPWVQKFTPNLSNGWIVRQYIADAMNTRTFHGHGHFMDALYDGGAQFNDPSPAHNNNATWLMELIPACSIPDAPKALHITFEVDAHFNSRRWCGLLLTPNGDQIIRPAIQKLEGAEAPSESGDAFAWEIEMDVHKAWTFHGIGNANATRRSVINSGFVADQDGPGPPQRFGRADRTFYNATYHSSLGRALNGPANFLDRRHRFDLLINKTFFRIYEEGIYMAELNFPVALDFGSAKLSLTHHVYHTANDIDEIVQRNEDERFWVNLRSFDEVRHWDNQGVRIVSAIPANTVDIRTYQQ